MKAKNMLGNQSGFTLIEIIAVLIIIGILAAVAVPKYFDLTSEAQTKAIQAAGAELQGRINQNFGENLLSYSGDCTTALSNLNTTEIQSNLGDFSVVSGNIPTTESQSASIILRDTKNSYTASYTVFTPSCP
ncbi:MAG: prepilin-type N-terminal cleavage/methylation domain-containing protein [Desulfobacteraceae bacterium]|nr:prepilin-type N-terminal cleavage/methylation domain-containing protein [Desulfobacteraceae bacterium]MCF8035629.1 prepilin-type N-terminal cleavage/methylation domain-containing protein [Desulfobacteraceae bacterium]